ncbi:MAG: type IV pilus assembly protein PilM, partial [Lentisphaeria bacterium]
MATSDRIISIDIGASSIRMAEFEYKGNNIILHAFDWRRMKVDDEEEDRVGAITDALKDMFTENNFTTRRAHICTSGQASLVKFVKLPPVMGGENRIHQMVQHEAQANIPFPLDEVSWDYQLLSSGEDSDELEVMLVVIKNEIIGDLIDSATKVGLTADLVDVSSAALLNAVKANGIGADQSVMLLDIGDRCSDLLFIDGKRFFSRTINIAGQTITQQIAKEFKIGLEEAEDLKRKHGFVALGAGYEDPESEVAAVISKIVRNVMTRLHGEINRSKSIYVTQQKGTEPTALYLTGGSSLMRHTDTFFEEKLGVETLYFNPFEAVRLSPRIQPEKLQPIAHTFGAVVGTALRSRGRCPIEISLMPESMRRKMELSPKKKFIFMAMLSVVAMFGLAFLAGQRKYSKLAELNDSSNQQLESATSYDSRIDLTLKESKALEAQLNAINQLFVNRTAWLDIINKIFLQVPKNITIIGLSPIYEGMVVKAAEPQVEERSRRRSSGGDEGLERKVEVPKNIYEA